MDLNFTINIWRVTIFLYVTIMKLNKDVSYHSFYRVCNSFQCNVTYTKPKEDTDYDND